jgi:hypothetical protein
VKVRFLGTRGEIALRSGRHRRHSVLLVSHGGRALLVDCGRDWLGRVPQVDVEALLRNMTARARLPIHGVGRAVS